MGGLTTRHPPLLGMRRQQGRDSGEMECWDTRADRLPAGRGERSPAVSPKIPSSPFTLLRPFGPPKTDPLEPSWSMLLTKVGLTGTALDLHPFGPSFNEKMADQLFQGVP